MDKKSIDVCITPEQIHHFDLTGKIVVVTDILRATSCMVTGIANGVKSIIPVATLEECQAYQFKGYLAAAERGGEQVEGFDLGNSPFEYMNPALQDKSVAVTTTNGTQAITKSLKAKSILIGAFLNLSAIAKHLVFSDYDVIVHCSGWKGLFSMEDTLFAGALLDRLSKTHSFESDAALMALSLYRQAKPDLSGFIHGANHAKRLSKFNIQKDIDFCCKMDQYNLVPRLVGREIVAG
ncbi:MAG: 2-phosphosulfolactate phosphatase [Cyclobacteriaceae bacterium]